MQQCNRRRWGKSQPEDVRHIQQGSLARNGCRRYTVPARRVSHNVVDLAFRPSCYGRPAHPERKAPLNPPTLDKLTSLVLATVQPHQVSFRPALSALTSPFTARLTPGHPE